jgi:hypothetical protein
LLQFLQDFERAILRRERFFRLRHRKKRSACHIAASACRIVPFFSRSNSVA